MMERGRAWLLRPSKTAVWAFVTGLLLVMACGEAQPPPDLPFEVLEGEVFLSEDPPMVQGAPGPEPEFDTSSLGTEWPLAPMETIEITPYLVRPLVEDLKITIMGVTRDGTEAAVVDGGGYCVWAKGSGEGSCRNFAEEQTIVGHRGFDGIVSWGPLPETTSVVVVEYGDTSLWQRPVGGFAVFDTELGESQEFTLTAMDVNGATIQTQEAVAR